jgi:hypothetical protein
MADQLRLAVSESFVTSFRTIMVVAGALALGSSACALLTLEGKATVQKT